MADGPATLITRTDLFILASLADEDQNDLIKDQERENFLEKFDAGSFEYSGLQLSRDQVMDSFCILSSDTFQNHPSYLTEGKVAQFKIQPASQICGLFAEDYRTRWETSRLLTTESGASQTAKIVWPPHQEKFALLINGDEATDPRGMVHDDNIVKMVESLLLIGFKPENIVVASTRHIGRLHPAIQVFAGTDKGVESALKACKPTRRDLLFQYVTGHGLRINESPAVALDEGTNITTEKLAEAVSKLLAGSLITVSDHCFSGTYPDQVVELMGQDKRIESMAPVTDPTFTDCENFVPHIREGLNTAYDPDGDGNSHFDEIFRMAIIRYNQSQRKKILGSYRRSVPAVTLKNLPDILRQKGPVLIDITAPWCTVCQSMDKTIENLNAFYGNKVQLYRIYDGSQGEGQKVVEQLFRLDLRVRKDVYPVVVYLVDGKIVQVKVEKMDLPELKQDFARYFGIEEYESKTEEEMATYLEMSVGAPTEFSLHEMRENKTSIEDIQILHTLMSGQNPEEYVQTAKNYAQKKRDLHKKEVHAKKFEKISSREDLAPIARGAQLELLGYLADPDSGDILTEVLSHSSDRAVVLGAIRGLGYLSVKQEGELLIKLYDSYLEDEEIRLEAVRSFSKNEKKFSALIIAKLQDVYRNDPSPTVRAEALGGLERIVASDKVTKETVEEILTGYLSAPEVLRKAMAYFALAAINKEKITPDHPAIQKMQDEMKGGLDKVEDDTRSAYLKFLVDTKAQSRAELFAYCKASGRIQAGDFEYLRSALEFSAEDDPKVAHEKLNWAIKIMKRQTTLLWFAKFLEIIQTYQSPKVREPVLFGLKHQDPQFRAETLKKIKQDHPSLQKYLASDCTPLLRDPSYEVRGNAFGLIAHVDPERAKKLAPLLYQDGSSMVVAKLFSFYLRRRVPGEPLVNAIPLDAFTLDRQKIIALLETTGRNQDVKSEEYRDLAVSIYNRSKDPEIKAAVFEGLSQSRSSAKIGGDDFVVIVEAVDISEIDDQVAIALLKATSQLGRKNSSVIVNQDHKERTKPIPHSLQQLIHKTLVHPDQKMRSQAAKILFVTDIPTDQVLQALSLGLDETGSIMAMSYLKKAAEQGKDVVKIQTRLFDILLNSSTPAGVRRSAFVNLYKMGDLANDPRILDMAERFFRSEDRAENGTARMFVVDHQAANPRFESFFEKLVLSEDFSLRCGVILYHLKRGDIDEATDMAEREFNKIKTRMDEGSLYLAIKDYTKSDRCIEKIFNKLEDLKKERRSAGGNPQVIRTRQ